MSILSSLLRQFRGDSPLVMLETIHGRFVSRKGDVITGQLERFSAHTRNELSMVLSMARRGDMIIDIGAHIGTFAIPLARRVGMEGHLYAFEADAENFQLLCRNITLNNLDQLVTGVNAIVHARPGRFRKIVPDASNSGMFTFLPEDGDISPPLPEHRVVSIDEWVHKKSLPRLDLLKIDVEGGEMGVLNCCRSVIEDFHPIIYMEINGEALRRFGNTPAELGDFLSERGYRLFRNTGHRNSPTDDFTITPLASVEEGGEFYDLLAFHEHSDRLPDSATL